MPVIHIPRDPSERQLAVFAAGWAGVFGLLGAVLFWRSGEGLWAVLCWAAGLAVPIAGVCSRRALRWVYLASLYAAFPFGWVLSHVVLAVVYYGLLTPAGLLMRWKGYDPLARRFDPAASSYWTSRPEADSPPESEPPLERYFRQY